jgi:DnaJ-class molecular chaperone
METKTQVRKILSLGKLISLKDEEPGDLIFKIKTLPHKTFTRQGNDLHMTTRITLLQALVGFSIEFEHLDGHKVTLARTDVTPPGTFLQLNDSDAFQVLYKASPTKECPNMNYPLKKEDST